MNIGTISKVTLVIWITLGKCGGPRMVWQELVGPLTPNNEPARFQLKFLIWEALEPDVHCIAQLRVAPEAPENPPKAPPPGMCGVGRRQSG